jgi:transcriptional regulator with XRE-family HTH domain
MKTLNDKLTRLPPTRRRRIEAQAELMIAEEMTLRDLRQALQLTQRDLAATLQIGQDGVSRLEQRSDLLLSTLQQYVAALGGELALVAQFPDRKPVVLQSLGEMSVAPGASPPRLKTARQRAALPRRKANTR